MKKIAGIIGSVMVSALLLTSCSIGHGNSEYEAVAKDKVATAGINPKKVSAGKMTSGNDFVTLEFKDITGDELLKSVSVLSAMNIPERTDRRIEWRSGDEKSILMFNDSNPDIDQITTFAKVLDAGKGKINDASFNLNFDKVKSTKPVPMVINLKDDLKPEEHYKTIEAIKAIPDYGKTEFYIK